MPSCRGKGALYTKYPGIIQQFAQKITNLALIHRQFGLVAITGPVLPEKSLGGMRRLDDLINGHQ